MDTKHTPTPWKLERLTLGGYHNIGIRVSGEVVSGYTAFINTRWPNENQCAEQEANAAFIVKAVNTHDALLASLKDALHCFLLDHAHDHPTANNWRATIAAAEGK